MRGVAVGDNEVGREVTEAVADGVKAERESAIDGVKAGWDGMVMGVVVEVLDAWVDVEKQEK